MTKAERAPRENGETESVTLEAVLGVVSLLASCVCPGARVSGRIKTNESHAGKMLRNDGAHPKDCVGVRVIVTDVADCYEVIRKLHGCFQHLDGEYDDYVEWPKTNGYQSLHSTILACNGHPVEVQVRTRAMHAVAEHGSASHRRYKAMVGIGPVVAAIIGARRHPASLFAAVATAVELGEPLAVATPDNCGD
jgi:(p)ppGpp synthase/HD superfamily hydrolase